MPRNIEIKAVIYSVEALLPCALALAGGNAERIHQDDTFFHVPHGRLKLRQFIDGSAELIHYQRPNSGQAKASDYVRVVAPEPEALREALARGCGVQGRVRKTRLLVLLSQDGFNSRIHLDRVEGLGDFMELEVVLMDGQSDAQGVLHANALMQQLGLADAPRIAGAYLDLLAPTAKAAGSAAAK
jgi:adenylate cyclase class IV